MTFYFFVTAIFFSLIRDPIHDLICDPVHAPVSDLIRDLIRFCQCRIYSQTILGQIFVESGLRFELGLKPMERSQSHWGVGWLALEWVESNEGRGGGCTFPVNWKKGAHKYKVYKESSRLKN